MVKKHKEVDGKLLSMNKSYSNLKMKQKERIRHWITEEVKQYYKEYGHMPVNEQFEFVLFKVYDHIEEADIWIPYGEIRKKFYGKRNTICSKVYGQILKEQHKMEKEVIHIETLPYMFSVCKVQNYNDVNLENPFCFIGKTDEENSLVCQSEIVPKSVIEREDGWKAFRIKGILDFSLIGVISGISSHMAQQGISVFVISTFNTDYIFVKEENMERAIDVLKHKGYTIIEN